MNRRLRRRRKAGALAVLLLLAAAALLLRFRFSPLYRDACEFAVMNAASGALNTAVTRQLREGSVDYAQIVLLEKDVNGSITALRTDMSQVARLRAEVFEILDTLVPQIVSMPIHITLGDVMMPAFFAGKGLQIPLRITALQMTGSEFYCEYENTGLNQTTQSLKMRFSVSVSYVSMLTQRHTEVESDVILAETVLLGQIPNGYVHLG